MRNSSCRSVKFAAGILIASLSSACGALIPSLDDPRVSRNLSPRSEAFPLSVDLLRGKTIQDMVVLIFRGGMDRQRWSGVFAKTRVLSALRGRMSEIDDRLFTLDQPGGFESDPGTCVPDGESEPRRFPSLDDLKQCLFDQKALLLADLGDVVEDLRLNDSAFMMLLDENSSCRFTESGYLEYRCDISDDDLSREERLGGLPRSVTPWQMRQPGVSDIWAHPWLESTVQSSRFSPGEFRIAFRLRAESRTPRSYRLVGEAEVLPGSHFTRSGAIVDHDPFGYVEANLKAN